MASNGEPWRERALPAIFQEAYAAFASNPICYAKRGGKWVPLTYAEFAEAVELFSRGLHALGIGPGDRVAILLENAPEWMIADHAILHLGAVTVPLHTALPSDQNAYCLKDSGAVALITEGALYTGLAPHRRELPGLAHVITVDGAPKTHAWSALASRGRAMCAEDPDGFTARAMAVKPDDLATLIYTSGTTGFPKGVILTHANLVYNVTAVRPLLNIDEDTAGLALLPLSHGFERIAELVGISVGASVFYSESIDPATVRENLRVTRPTILVGVPRVFEKAHARVMSELAKRPRLVRHAFAAALRIGEKSAAREMNGRTPTLAARLVRPLVFRQIRERMGGRLRLLISGGAPLSVDVARFFWAVGLPVYEGYGLTESGPILTLNRAGATRLGTVGRPMPGVELRVDAEGELIAKSPGIMPGYWHREDDDAHVLTPEGALRTGDIAVIDGDGFVRIVDRKKEIIVKSNGKNVAPAPIEKRLESSPGILQAVCVGDAKPFIGALIVPDVEELGRALDRPFTLETAHADPEVLAAVERAVERVNADLAGFERVKEFRILRRELTIDDGTLTPTLKVKRRVVGERFAAEVASIYRGIDDAHAPSSSRDS